MCVTALCLAAVGGGLVAASFALDGPVREAVVQSQKKGWRKSPEARFHGAVRVWGDWPWLMLGGGVVVAASWAAGRRRWVEIAAAAMISSTLAGALANASRLTTGRTRPRAECVQGFYGPIHDGRLLVGDSKFNSFPSGHAATAFGFAWPVVFAAPAAGIPVLAGAALVAWSSIALGAHHPSDVMVSVLLSLGVAWIVWHFVRERGEQVVVCIRRKWPW